MLCLLSYYLLMQLRNGARELISSCTQVKKELKTSLYLRASVVRLFALSILFHVHFYIGWTLCSSVFKSRHASQGGGGSGHRKWNRNFSYTSAKRHGACECDDLLCCSKCWVLSVGFYGVKAKYRLISRKFSGVSIRLINQSYRSISVRLLFLFCSHVFISKSKGNRSITHLPI